MKMSNIDLHMPKAFPYAVALRGLEIERAIRAMVIPESYSRFTTNNGVSFSVNRDTRGNTKIYVDEVGKKIVEKVTKAKCVVVNQDLVEAEDA